MGIVTFDFLHHTLTYLVTYLHASTLQPVNLFLYKLVSLCDCTSLQLTH